MGLSRPLNNGGSTLSTSSDSVSSQASSDSVGRKHASERRRTVTQSAEARRYLLESVNAGDLRAVQAAEVLGLSATSKTLLSIRLARN